MSSVRVNRKQVQGYDSGPRQLKVIGGQGAESGLQPRGSGRVRCWLRVTSSSHFSRVFSLPSALQQTARHSAGLLRMWAHCVLHPSVHLDSDMVSGPNGVMQNDHFLGAYCVGHRIMLFSSPLPPPTMLIFIPIPNRAVPHVMSMSLEVGGRKQKGETS